MVFNTCREVVTVTSTSIGFVMGLALNTAMQETLKRLPLKRNTILGAWLYAMLVLGLGVLVMYLLYKYVNCHVDSDAIPGKILSAMTSKQDDD